MSQSEEMIEVSRVTIITESGLEKTMLENVLKLGAKGYTCSYCFGKGRHEIMEDPYTGRSLVKIVILARHEVAKAILTFVHHERFKPFPATAYVDVVQVFADHAGF